MDGEGRRVEKTVKLNGVVQSTQTRRWLYRNKLKPVAELNGNGALVAQFVYGSKPNVPDYVIRFDPVNQVATGLYRVISDHIGSPRYVVNVNNANDVPFRVDYSAFGEIVGLPSGADWMPFGFAGGIYDPDTNLVRFGARDYDPMVGRWTAKDPIRFDGGQENLYVYVDNDPVNRRDPTGLYSWCELAVDLGEWGICELLCALIAKHPLVCAALCSVAAGSAEFDDMLCPPEPPSGGSCPSGDEEREWDPNGSDWDKHEDS